MRKIGLLLVALLLALSAICATQSVQAQDKTLTVFAASSLTDAFKEIADSFEAANAGVEVIFNFAASSALATQLKEAAPADVFASANMKQMDVVQKAGRIVGKPVIFAHNRLILIVPSDNPAQITELADLANNGVKLVLAAPNVPVRDYTNTMLDRLAEAEDLGEDYKTAVLANIVSEEDNVRQVVVKIALGEADAGIVYSSDVTPDIADKVIALPIPDEYNTIADYPVAIVSDAPEAELAQQFIDYLLSDAGQEALVKWGFISIRETVEATPEAAATTDATPETN
ncbi:MAG: molybdate ABC transporter substrate-binding protein [Anaerolineae bacterium]|nr:molybdate ABC transporter substrate-binding protein [Anaerolineae bacterium]